MTPFLVDEILPAREVHLIGGASGSGKTTFLFQTIEQITNGQLVFGRQSHPAPSCYVACDRSTASIDRTLSRMNMTLAIPRLSLVENRLIIGINGVIGAAKRLVPDLRILYIDAMAVLVPDGKISDYKAVGDFLTHCTEQCNRHDLTMVGLHHATKVKEGERFLNPRQRLLGSVAWGGFSDTVMLVEPKNPEDPTDDTRSILLLPRNAGAESYDFHFNPQGRLQESPAHESLSKLLDERLWPLLQPGQLYKFEAIMALTETQKLLVTNRTVRRWLDEKLSEVKIERPKKGHYCKAIVQ